MRTKDNVKVSKDAYIRVVYLKQIIPQKATAIVVITRMHKSERGTVMADDQELIWAVNDHSWGRYIQFTEKSYVWTGESPIIVGEEYHIYFVKEVAREIFF